MVIMILLEFTNAPKSPVIGLTEVSIDSRIARSHNDAAIILFLENWPCRLRWTETALEVNVQNQIQILIGDFGKTFVSQNARIVHQNINASEILNCRLYDFIAIRYRIVIGARDTAYQ